MRENSSGHFLSGNHHRQELMKNIFWKRGVVADNYTSVCNLIDHFCLYNGPNRFAYVIEVDSEKVISTINEVAFFGDRIRGPSSIDTFVGQGSKILYQKQGYWANKLILEIISEYASQSFLYERPVVLLARSGGQGLFSHKTYLHNVEGQIFGFQFFDQIGSIASEKTPIEIVPSISRGASYTVSHTTLEERVLKETGKEVYNEFIAGNLTDRKQEVLRLASEHSQSEIAIRLGITRDAVRRHGKDSRDFSERNMSMRFALLREMGIYYKKYFFLPTQN